MPIAAELAEWLVAQSYAQTVKSSTNYMSRK